MGGRQIYTNFEIFINKRLVKNAKLLSEVLIMCNLLTILVICYKYDSFVETGSFGQKNGLDNKVSSPKLLLDSSH